MRERFLCILPFGGSFMLFPVLWFVVASIQSEDPKKTGGGGGTASQVVVRLFSMTMTTGVGDLRDLLGIESQVLQPLFANFAERPSEKGGGGRPTVPLEAAGQERKIEGP